MLSQNEYSQSRLSDTFHHCRQHLSYSPPPTTLLKTSALPFLILSFCLHQRHHCSSIGFGGGLTPPTLTTVSSATFEINNNDTQKLPSQKERDVDIWKLADRPL